MASAAEGSTLAEALNDALRSAMQTDDNVLVMGEDVGVLGGVFRVTDGLYDAFGADRCIDTPLAEAGIVGTALGLTMAGWKPVCEIQFDAFGYPALDQVICHVSRYRWRSGHQMSVPLVLRMPYGGGVRAPELHQESPEAYYVHTPGLKVVVPSTPADGKGLLAAAIREPDPVIVLEPKALYRSIRGPVPVGDHSVAIGSGARRREGDDVTLIAYGAMVRVALAAGEVLATNGVEADVIDLRSLKPLDENLIVESASTTGRVAIVHEAPRTLGVGAEVAALLAEHALFDLRGPVLRVTGYDVPYPYWSIEDSYLPSVERVVAAARELMRY